MKVSRRAVLKSLAAAALLPALRTAPAAAPVREIAFTAAVNRQQIVPSEYPDTEVWSYNAAVPGPELRVRQGDRLRVIVDNRLPDETTVHWHGVRVPNAMDGVPHVTQPPIARGGRFVYEFALPDAGTYWYHPHQRSHEQVARGLYGALVVEEREPIAVDRDVTWTLSDWRLAADAAQRADFDSLFDLTHAGRIGNTVTINGRFTAKDGVFNVRAGERIRLRLVNAAVARVFRLHFDGHAPQVIAFDGQPVEPHPLHEGLVLGPGMRADLVLDCGGTPGSRHAVRDDFYPRASGRLIELAYGAEAPLRDAPPDTPLALPGNQLPEPDVGNAERHQIVFEGGAMGGLRDAVFEGERLPLARLAREHHLAWTVNGVAVKGHVHAPLLTLRRGGHYVLQMRNDTAWHHPIHLHGHVFRVIAVDGAPARYREWRDTVLMNPRQRIDIAFVADNPGDWMFHCHVLAHQAGGMMAMLRVA